MIVIIFIIYYSYLLHVHSLIIINIVRRITYLFATLLGTLVYSADNNEGINGKSEVLRGQKLTRLPRLVKYGF